MRLLSVRSGFLAYAPSAAKWRATVLLLVVTLLIARASLPNLHTTAAAQGTVPTATATPDPTVVPTAPSDVHDAQDQLGGLFSQIEGDPPPSSDVETLASRLVGIDFGQLANAIESPVGPKDPVTGKPTEPQALVLNLFDDVVFNGIVEHVEPTASGHALWGRLDGVELGTMTLVVNGSVVVGTVRTLGAVYTIRTAGDGMYVISQIDESSLPPLGEPLEGPVTPRDSHTQTDDIPPDDGSVIDVMVVYTPLAKHREGGRAAIEALIDLFVVETNQAYANSGVIHQLNLVLREEVDYIETGKATDLGRLRDASDGYMDHVHGRRDLYAADFVHFVVGKSDRGGGAIQGGAFAMTAYYRTDFVFAHELGHNMGLFHDRYVAAPSGGAHFGYVNQRMFDADAPKSARWRTIMAYPNQCSEVGGFSCPEVQYFSNPENMYNGDPMGVSTDNPSTGVDGPADAVGTLNDRREFNANRRRSLTSPTPRVALTLSPYWLAEDGGVSTVTATLHRPSSEDTVVTLSASPSDAVTLSGSRTLTIPAGRTEINDSVTITGIDNDDQTGDVTVEILATAENPSDLGVIAPEPVDLLIADDETRPVLTLSLSRPEVLEGEDWLGRRTFVTATLENMSSAETIVTVSASPAEAVEKISWNTLTIPAGQKESKSGVNIFAVDDTEFTESKKMVTVSGTATNPQGITGPESVTLTIIDDDGPYFVDDRIAYSFTVGVAASRVLPEAAYGDGPLTYSLSPALSNGVTFVRGPTARIGVSTTSAVADETSYTLTATDADGDTDTMTVSITVRSQVCPNSAAVSGYANPGIAADCEVLLSSRDSLRGDKSLNWSESLPIDAWQGVEIANDRIVGVDMSSLNLTGTLPSELGNLTSLQLLDFSENELTGLIPAQLGDLTNLESLVLYRNQLTGPIPSELGNLENLHTLRLGDNRLIGEISSELGRLSNLQELLLGDNQLTGSIPSELSKLSKLSRLFLARNRLSGGIPAWLSGLSNLRSLNLGSNQLGGPIPAELRDLDKLERLFLHGNQLTGKIPIWLSGLSNLRALGLSANQLEGPIPSELGNLSNLQNLHLRYNQLTGPIPPELGNLSNLQNLHLRYNQLTGPIPPELGNLDNLRSLYLDDNELDGGIPSELGNLSNLQILHLRRNQLTGPIPSELGNLANLTVLFLDGNQLDGKMPPELGNLSNLKYLWLFENQLSGPIPPELGNLAKLEVLHLYNNKLTGQIPSELGKLANLEVLQLSGNNFTGCMPEGLRDVEFNDLHVYLLPLCDDEGTQSDCSTGTAVPDPTNNPGLVSDCEALLASRDTLIGTATLNWSADTPITEWNGVVLGGTHGHVTELGLGALGLNGRIPKELGSLANLTHLYLDNNQLTGEIPPELGGLSNLTLLSLYVNQLTGEIPPELGGLSNLTLLSLYVNQLTGEIPPELGGLSNLTLLSLYVNQLTGEIPPELGGLSNLTRLSLYGNQLTGEIPPELGGLSNLTELVLGVNQLTGEIPPELGGLSNLTRLSLYGNQLTGEIPPELGGLSNLTGLFLGVNQLTGEIPPELGGLSNLTRLSLSDNQLTGEIPPELGGLSNLTGLSLYGNQLTGEIPPELGGLSNLTGLSLYGNQLTGEIPPELGGLSNLTGLFLGVNQLTGEIPPELGGLSNLTRLSLSDNQLTGEIPPELGGLSNLQRLYLSDNRLTGCVPPRLRDVPDNDLDQLGLPFCPLSPPEASTISSVTSEMDSITISWATPLSDGGSDITAYDLRHIETDDDETVDPNWTVVEDVWTSGGDALEYTLTGLTVGTEYDIQVRAVNEVGDGPWSVTNTATLTTASVCLSGGAVADPANTGLVSDCEALLSARDTLAETGSNWSEDTPIARWDGVRLAGTPQRVTRLVLPGKGLRGTIPPDLGRLSMLTDLNLRSNALTGEIPEELGNLTNLRVLNLHSNKLSGDLPDLSRITGLEELYLPNNYDETVQDSGLTGTVPTWLNGMTKMRELWLWGNQLSGTIPDLSGMTSLQKLKLANNMLTGGVPDGSMLPPNVTWLIINSNPLGGGIPDLSELTSLRLLWLHSNGLTGSIPAGDMLPPNVDDLNLRDNMLSGEIPDLSDLDKATRVRLHGNDLTGEIPATLGDLDSLQSLWLHGNILTGSIPKELGSLTNLQRLWLSDNNLSGQIPVELGDLSSHSLVQWRLSGEEHQFTGCLPAGLAAIADNDFDGLNLQVCTDS